MIIQHNHDKTAVRITANYRGEEVTIQLEAKDAATLLESLKTLVPPLFPVRAWSGMVKTTMHRKEIEETVLARTKEEAESKLRDLGWVFIRDVKHAY